MFPFPPIFAAVPTFGTEWTCPGKGDRLDTVKRAMGLLVGKDDDYWVTDLQLTGQPCGEYDARRLRHATLLPSPDPQEAPLPRTAAGDMAQTLEHLEEPEDSRVTFPPAVDPLAKMEE